MNEQEITLLDALRIGMEAEELAAATYADAAQRAGNSLGRGLFERLAEFERYHYRKLAALEQSLREQGAFIKYEGYEMKAPVHREVKGFEEPNRMSLLGIITEAMEFERKAKERYAGLAKQVTDPDGRAMFERLAQEEQTHFRILEKAYWSLNNHGVWNWPYAEEG